ncbi:MULTISPECIES: hypothetical protein [Exiguobacterium]|uniref:hypothetical protein n=1 Tax=Exiguobacterium TaxID=33986 RepID=UPI001BEA6721|nr:MULTISPECIES: hypothetical protein [Exiguobacterium]MCT4777181.1 hypothetical protein [Exiguobacterium aquaticum]MCT4787901.1 hypothetical protein [Exiguobacterium mexicanum]
MEGYLYSKGEVIEKVWLHSRYHGNLLSYCDQIAGGKSGNGFVALIFLFNLTENIFKDRTKNYEASFMNVINELRTQKVITEIEYRFLNDKNNSIRKLRNLLAHANLSKFSFSMIEDGREIYYPLTENENCLKLYENVSNVLFNLILRLVSYSFSEPIEIDLDKEIQTIEINIVEFTPEQLLNFKGIDASTLPEWQELNETDKYRYAENASDVNMYEAIFKMIKYRESEI